MIETLEPETVRTFVGRIYYNSFSFIFTLLAIKPSIKLQILLLCFHTFLTEVVGRIC